MKIKFSIFVIFALLLRVSVTILAEENPCIFFAPQIMNESNNIIVPVYAKNLRRITMDCAEWSLNLRMIRSSLR